MSTAFWPLVPEASSGRRGIVQPHVDALDQVPADVDVVVLDEDDAAGEARVVPQVGDLLDQLLARLVGRMGLAGEDDLHRADLGSLTSWRSRSRSVRIRSARL